jgi:DNA primase large subunit
MGAGVHETVRALALIAPRCITRYLKMIESGQNEMKHFMRRHFTLYMKGLGIPIDAVVALLNHGARRLSFGDRKDAENRYQVGYIYGHGYTEATCRTIARGISATGPLCPFAVGASPDIEECADPLVTCTATLNEPVETVVLYGNSMRHASQYSVRVYNQQHPVTL